MTATIDFIFDFASPNAYCVHKVLPEILERAGAKANYVPCLLGGIFKSTNNRAPMIAFKDVKGKIDYELLEMKRFLIKHKLSDFKMNSAFPVTTVMMMRAAIVAQKDGNFEKYIDAGFRLMWENDKKMDDPEIFVAALNEEGLDGAGYLEKTQDQAIKDELKKNTEEAVAKGVFGMPTFFVGNEMFVGKERLNQVEEEALKAG